MPVENVPGKINYASERMSLAKRTYTMPVIKSAIKKLRKDRKREAVNDEFRKKLQEVIKTAKTAKSPAALAAAYSMLDKAAKNHVLHKNKAARTKSSLARLAGTTKRANPEPNASQAVKKTPKAVKVAKKSIKTPKKTAKKK